MKTYEGTYGGCIVDCEQLKMRFKVNPGVRGFGYKCFVSDNEDGTYTIKSNNSVLEIKSFESYIPEKKKSYEQIYLSLNGDSFDTVIEELQKAKNKIDNLGGTNIIFNITDYETYLEYFVEESEEEYNNRIKSSYNQDKELYEKLKARFKND